MAGFTVATAQKVLNKILRNTDFTQGASLYLSLHTADPGETGANELPSTSYTRQAITFGAPSTKTCSNTAGITFTSMPAATLKYSALWQSSTSTVATNYWWSGGLNTAGSTSTSLVVSAGASVQFAVGDIDVDLDPTT